VYNVTVKGVTVFILPLIHIIVLRCIMLLWKVWL